MRLLRALVLVAVSAAVLPAQTVRSALGLQDPVPGAVRAEEIWGPAPQKSGRLRKLKHIELVPSDSAWLTLGGSVRLRGIDYRDYNFSPAAAMQDDYTEWRTLLSADVWAGTRAGWHARGFAEWRDAQGFGRTLPGGVRTNEADRADWQSHFVEAGSGHSGVRYGRQDLAMGRERLIGMSDWSNSRRSFDGVRATLAALDGLTQLELFDGRVMAVSISERDRPDTSSHARIVALTHNGAAAKAGRWRLAGLQLYRMDIDQQSGTVDRRTTGVRMWWDRRAQRTDWTAEIETASQKGTAGVRDVRAWFGVAEAGLTWRSRKFMPSVSAGYEIGSGSGADSLARTGTFAAPYATSHSHNGIADVFGRGNLTERRVGFGLRPFAALQLNATLRDFRRTSLADGAWTKSNTLLRGVGGSSARGLGDELDLTAQWTPSPKVRVLGGAAWVRAGDFIRETGTASPVRWAFLSTQLAF